METFVEPEPISTQPAIEWTASNVKPHLDFLLAGYRSHSADPRPGAFELNWRLHATEVARDAFFKTGFEAIGLPRIMAQYGVLRYIYFSEDKCLSQSQIMRLRGVSSANMTNLIHSLERAGLVRRGVTPEDKRRTSVYLTEAGIAFCERTVPMVGADIGRVGECFSDAELAILNELLARLHIHVEKLAAERRSGDSKRLEEELSSD